MHIDSGNLIMMPTGVKVGAPQITKEAQNLEVVKTPEKFTDRELTRALRDAIIAEEGAIKQYETVVDATDNEKVKEILQDISNEEKVHVGELQKLLNDLLPDEEELLENGEGEVDDSVGTVDEIDDTRDTGETEE